MKTEDNTKTRKLTEKSNAALHMETILHRNDQIPVNDIP